MWTYVVMCYPACHGVIRGPSGPFSEGASSHVRHLHTGTLSSKEALAEALHSNSKMDAASCASAVQEISLQQCTVRACLRLVAGEPELAVAPHVLKRPISVYMAQVRVILLFHDEVALRCYQSWDPCLLVRQLCSYRSARGGGTVAAWWRHGVRLE